MSGIQRLWARILVAALAMFLVFPVGSVFAQDATVNMVGVSFSPVEVHVAPGATVQWVNTSPLQHTVTSDDGWFDSGLVDPDGTFSQEFDAPGVYQYYCQPHGAAGLNGMSATIIVDDPGAGAPAESAPAESA
jgi:plastocyanin